MRPIKATEGLGKAMARLRIHSTLAVVLGVMSAAIAAGGAFAATQMLTANSGISLTSSSVNARALGTGEALTVGAADAVSVGVRDTADIPFAPGYSSWQEQEVAEQIGPSGNNPPAGTGFMTVSALRWQVAEAAACSWADYWLAATADGNSSAAASAASELEAAPSWSSITGMSSEPSGLAAVAGAVSAGDTKLLGALIDTESFGSCSVLGPITPVAGMTAQQAQSKLGSAAASGRQILASDPLAAKLGVATS